VRTALTGLAAAALAVAAAPLVATAAAAAPSPATGSYNGLALTPPMGFNDWNVFGCNVSAAQIESAALAMHNNGMQKAGYDYVNVDDCWINGRSVTTGAADKAAAGRDASGHLIADPTYFPPSAPGKNDGMKLLADYVHKLGLKFGIYEDIGTATCQGLAGSYGHEATDAQDFASWGVDYLKYDDCNLPAAISPTPAGYEAAYKVMSDALKATGRPIVYSICEHTEAGQSWLWGATQSNLWRTTTDIRPNYASMLTNFTKNSVLAAYAGPGHWNDPDMLEIGTGQITALAGPAARGDTNVKVNSVNTAIVGSPITIGTAADGTLQSDTVTAVGTAATSTTLFAPAAAGDTNVKVAGVSGFTVGGPITVDTGTAAEHATVTAVGTAGARGTLFTAAAPGDTNLKVSTVAGLTVGQPITVDAGANVETPTVTAIGTPGVATTLSSANAVGDTTIKVASVTGVNVGDTLAIDTGANTETVTVTSLGTAGAAGTGVGITPALGKVHAGGFRGAAVKDISQPGTGVTISPALGLAHAAGAATVGNGTGITFSPALGSAHAASVAVGGPLGTGLTLAQPVQRAHAAGSGVGISGMTVTEAQSEFSLWAVEAAPMIAGTDIADLAAPNLAVYTNRDLIAVDQDRLGVQASVVSNANGQWVLEKPLANGDTAVVLFNAADSAWTDASASLASLGLGGHQPYLVHDLWTGRTSVARTAVSAGTIPAHGAVMVRIAAPGRH
jgi:alpha-galactosidase